MTTALDQEARTALERFVQRARRLLEEDLAREAEGRFGIHVADGEVEDEDGLHLDPARAWALGEMLLRSSSSFVARNRRALKRLGD